MSRGPGFTEQEKALPRYLYVEHRLELKEVTAALHAMGQMMGQEKWANIVYDTVRRWAKAGQWEKNRLASAGIDRDEPTPNFWQIDDDGLRRRLALTAKLHGEAMTGRTQRARHQAAKLYIAMESALEEQNVRREFLSIREPAIIMEAIVRIAGQLSGKTVDRDQVIQIFDHEYKAIAARSGLRLLPKKATAP